MLHFFGHMSYRIKAGKGVHGVSNAHDPGDTIRPATYAVEDEEAGCWCKFLAHGQYDNCDDQKAEYR